MNDGLVNLGCAVDRGRWSIVMISRLVLATEICREVRVLLILLVERTSYEYAVVQVMAAVGTWDVSEFVVSFILGLIKTAGFGRSFSIEAGIDIHFCRRIGKVVLKVTGYDIKRGSNCK